MMTKRDLLNVIEFDSLIKLNYDIKLIKQNKYFTKKDFIDALGKNLSIDECEYIISLYKKNISLNEISKNFLTIFRPTGNFLREKFVQHLLYKEIKGKLYNDIIFFEFPIKNNRTDITRINGYSYAYEIKSVRDVLSRSIGQTKEFLSVFDYVYLIVDNDIDDVEIDEKVGIIKVIRKNGMINFKIVKKPKQTCKYDSLIQLRLLQKKELLQINKKYDFCHDKSREDLQQSILKKFDQNSINLLFKHTLKERYRRTWFENLKYIS